MAYTRYQDYPGIHQVANAVLGYAAVYQITHSVNKPLPVVQDKVMVKTNQGRELEITVLPFYNASQQVVGYEYDKKNDEFIVTRRNFSAKVKQETFKWDTKAYYKSDRCRRCIADSVAANKRNLEDRTNTEVKALYDAIVEKTPNIDDYFKLTPADAKEKLKEMGWTFPDHLNFERFSPGSWLDHSEAPYRNNCSAGVNNVMDFNTKTIKQIGWSSDD